MTGTPEDALSAVFGFSAFRPGQREIVDRLLARIHTLTVMPTGAGKSLCYQVPALIFEAMTVVVSPLVALMDDQVAGLRVNGVKAACIHSGQSRDANVAAWRRARTGRVRLLYMSPGCCRPRGVGRCLIMPACRRRSANGIKTPS